MNAITSSTSLSVPVRGTALEDGVSVRACAVFAVAILAGSGFLYSLGGATLGRALFPQQAAGSLLRVDGQVRGSALVAQPFAGARYFQPRPSAAGYDPMAAAGSNLARSNPDLRARIAVLTAQVARREGIVADQVPAELVTQSGSGLDPHLSPRAAQVQVARVARSRGMREADVAALVAAHTQAPTFGVLGQPRVNVLQLNVALDRLPQRAASIARP